MMVRIQNKNLKNSLIITRYGQYSFDEFGRSEVPEELARELITLQGFTLIDAGGNPTDFPDDPHTKITLESGVVWEALPSGYVAVDGDKSYTVSGSAVEIGNTNIVPINVAVQNGTISLSPGIDVTNIHVLGVTANDTIYVGDIVYNWKDTDNNLENGYELVQYIPSQSKVTLDSGVVAESIDGGYTLEDNDTKITISGSAVQVDETGIVPSNITLEGSSIKLADDIDVSNLHVAGVTENDTVAVGDKTYVWTNLDNNTENGYELQEYTEPQPPEPVTKVTLESGVVAESISGGYTLENNDTKITISGSAVQVDESGVVPTNVTLSAEGLSFDSAIDTENLHVVGVTENDTVTVGDKIYVWADLDNNAENGLELQEYYEPEPPAPEPVTLPSGVVAESIDGGYTLADTEVKITISGSAVQVDESGVVPTNVTLEGSSIKLADTIDTANLHVSGVTEGDTVAVGDKVYIWTDLDGNTENGYELQEYTEPQPPEPIVTLPSGVIAESIEGGYTLENTDTKVTLSGTAVTVDETGVVPTNVTLTSDGLAFDPAIDVNNLHVAGVAENDTVTVGTKVYVWTDLDGNTENGLELQEYVEPQPPEPVTKVTLDSGVVWESIAGGYVAEHEDVSITVSGSAVQVDETGIVPTNITLTADNKLELEPGINLNDFHVLGVTEGSTVVIINDKTYIWKNVDNNLENGYELVEYTEPQPPEPITKVTLESGVIAESIEGGYTLENNDTKVTLSGTAVTVDETGVVPTNVTLTADGLSLDSNIDINNLHVAGVTENDTVSVGTKIYVWTDLDDNTENGLELQEYVEPQPPEPVTKVTLDSGVVWESIAGGHISSLDEQIYTVSGSAIATDETDVVPTNVTLTSDGLAFDPDIDTANLHVAGVTENDTIAVGDKTFIWVELDGNAENGLELKEYITKVTLESGVIAESIEGGYTLENHDTKITLSGTAVTVDETGVVPTNVTLTSDGLAFDPAIDVNNLHVSGVTENDTVAVGTKIYVWTDLDGNAENGLELKEYITKVTLDSGISWESIPGGYVVADTNSQYTLSGSGLVFTDSEVVPDNVVLTTAGLQFSSDTAVSDIHVSGVTENDTIAVGDKVYIWSDLDNNAENGLELKEYITKVTLDSGVVWESISGGYVATNTNQSYTISGSAVQVDETGVVPTNVTLESAGLAFDPDIDIANLHVAGVDEGTLVTINSTPYLWSELDNNTANGLELKEYVTKITLNSGVIAESINGGYTLENSDTKVTVSGSAITLDETGVVPTNVTLEGSNIKLADNIDTANLHVAGVAEGTLITVNNTPYIWTDVDTNAENGLELKEYITKVTLDSGVVWESIAGGYVVSDTTNQYTLSGSGLNFDEDSIVPNNVTLSGNSLQFSSDTAVSDIHVIGVTETETLTVGDKVYVWADLDDNAENGLELKEYITKVTLPSGVVAESINGGYTLENNDTKVTISGTAVQVDETGVTPTNVTLEGSSIKLADNIDTANLHISGIAEGTLITVNNTPYIWIDLDNNTENGLELKEYITKVTLDSGVVWESIAGGYVATVDEWSYTLSGSAITIDDTGVVPTNVTLSADGLSFEPDIDIENVHVSGITEGELITINSTPYIWTELDGNAENGLELKEYITKVTLESGVIAESIDGGYTLENTDTKITLSGSAVQVAADNVTPVNITLEGSSIKLTDDIDTANLHVAGVTENDTVSVGTKVYVWTDLDGNAENGLELKEYITKVTLDSGVVWESVAGGYVASLDGQMYTISGSAVQVDETGVVPTNVTLTSDGLAFDPAMDTENIHVAGVTENDTVAIGDKTFIWTDTDNNTENGLELKEYITKVTLESGVVAESIDGGYTLENNDTKVTISGSAVIVDETDVVPTNVTLTSDGLAFDPAMDTENIHVAGVTENDTISVGTKVYIWSDLDNNAENGLELKEYITKVTLDSGVVAESIDGGYTLENADTKVTVSGSAITLDEIGVVPTNVTLTPDGLAFDPDIDVNNLHVSGVTENDTVAVGTKIYVWSNGDNNAENGLELQEYQPPETVPAFSYDFDNVAFTLTGGLDSDIDAGVLNEHSSISSSGLAFDPDVITNANDVHIQGLDAGTHVTVDGKVYELRDTDNNLENGYELDIPEFAWVRVNQWTPYVWKCTKSDVDYLTVIGSDDQPILSDTTVTVTGKDIKTIQNLSEDTITVTGSLQGVLTTNVTWDVSEGMKGGIHTNSHILKDTELYLPKVKIAGILEPVTYTFEGGVLTIHSGALDIPNVVVTGKALTTVNYKGRPYYVNIHSGKLVPNAWQRK